jgi:myo-inositol 2-dehydrogenase/D-chiro-inositol 1-dehydrogenase
VARALRFAVLGAGRIGTLHATLLARRVEGAELATVADVDPARARRLAARLGVMHLPVDEAIESSVDAVAVCASTPVQANLVVAAATAGRHVFCEKPLAQDVSEIDRAIAAAERAGVLLHVGFNRRFDPSHAGVRKAVVTGAVGKLHLLRITSRDPAPPPPGYAVPGGILLDTTLHDFDMARFISGSEVVDVFVRGAARIEGPRRGEWDVDTVVAVLRHADGTITTIDNSWQATYGYDQRVEAFGSKGMATSDHQHEHQTSIWGARGARSSRLRRFFAERYAEAYARQWSAVITAIQKGGAALVDGRSARAALSIALAARRSLEHGQPVLVSALDQGTPAGGDRDPAARHPPVGKPTPGLEWEPPSP